MEHSQIILNVLQERNISPYKLAKETGISESLFSKWKKKPTSEISSSNLERIADYLGYSVDYLLGREEQNEKLAPGKRGEPSDKDMRLIAWFRSLPQETRKAILTLGAAPEGLDE